MPNITSDRETGIGAWSDGELVRAIREIVSKQGPDLFPMMSHTEHRALLEGYSPAIVA